MGRTVRSLGFLFSAAVSGLAPAASLRADGGAATPDRRQPNIVFILGEGLGWSSTSVPMDARLQEDVIIPGLTPNLEKLASGGMRFSDFYVSAPRCTPSRASFITGIGAAKLHMTYVNEGGRERRGGRGGGEREEPLLQRMLAPPSDRELPLEVRTTAEVLSDAGYAVAHFGKWHVGREDPRVHGFATNDGPNTNVGPGRNREPNPEEGIAITDRGLAFMAEQVKAGRPFFVQMSHYGAGLEEEVTPESLRETRDLIEAAGASVRREKDLVRLAAARDMDKAIGRIMSRLKELGVSDRTYIFFSTDHGSPGGGGRGPGSNAPLSGAKGSIREGGIRVPFVVWGPGVKAGAVSGTRAIGMDLLPTFAELAGHPVAVKPADRDAMTAVEGGSLVAVLSSAPGATVNRPREEVVIHFPHYDLNNGGPASAIFLGNDKLIRNDDTGERMLFDVRVDPQERTNRAALEPERVKQLEQMLDAYLKAVRAPMAVPNPAASRDERGAR